jgi:DNA-directed RNA polymerase specialized sigma subunit
MLVNLTEKEVITRRYIMGQSWETICNTMRYCQRQIMRIHKRALEKLEKMSLNVSKFL